MTWKERVGDKVTKARALVCRKNGRYCSIKRRLSSSKTMEKNSNGKRKQAVERVQFGAKS